MNLTLYTVIALISVLIVGFVTVVREAMRLLDVRNEIVEFHNKFVELISNPEQFDQELYLELTRQSLRIQELMGGEGFYALYRPSWSNFAYRDYPIIINFLPEIRSRLIQGRGWGNSQLEEFIALMIEAIMRRVGELERWRDDVLKVRRKPLRLFREGMRTILGIPVYILYGFGLINETRLSKILKGGFFSVISSLASLIGFFSAVMGIVLGWEDFIERVISVWSRVLGA